METNESWCRVSGWSGTSEPPNHLGGGASLSNRYVI